MGVRYEFFGLPEEVNGRIGNVDFEAITNTENPVNAFIVPKNVQTTGFAAVDGAIATSVKASNNHTLKGQDWNNVAPRLGFAWTPSQAWVVRGGYGIFYDRPSAAFINTVFSNYPFLREQEVTFPARRGADGLGVVAAGSDCSRSTSTCRTASSGRPARPAPIRSATART